MRKILLMCCFLLGVTAFCRAQGGGGMRRSPADQASALQTQLNLTDDQKAKVVTILTAQATKRDSIRTASNGDRDAMMQAMMPLMKDTNSKIKAILTPDQATAYDKMIQDRMDKMKQGGGGGGN
jgi:periplasmic protein CpxP/Spy